MALGRTSAEGFNSVRNACVAVFVQMRKAFASAGVLMTDSDDLLPYETAFVVVYCFAVTAIDLTTLYYVTNANWNGWCGSGLTVLHPFLWFCNIFFGVAVAALVVGKVIQGLAGSDAVQYGSDSDIFYGLSPNDIVALNTFMGMYMNGAWSLVIGAFLSVPPQGWLISAAANERQIKEARNTEYKPLSMRQGSESSAYYNEYFNSNSKGEPVSFKAYATKNQSYDAF